MSHRIAFAGFRHPHIFALWSRAKEHSDCEIVGAWENDPVTRETLKAGGEVTLTHDSFEAMLAESDCGVVAIGDTYARRGALAIAALQAGKHLISDKPLCTSLDELAEIKRLAREKKLFVGCQLDLREAGSLRQLRRVIQAGTLGEVCTITTAGQHPLRYGSRAAWYFEPGQHGGTINDIGIHLFDLAPWLTGSPWKSVLVARAWNAKATETPHFKDCAQFLATLENGASCFADLSYLAPDTLGFDLPQYWRITVHGTKGMAETAYDCPTLTVVTDEDTAPQELPALTETPTGYLQDFLDEISGSPSASGLTTAQVFTAARAALEAQALADQS
ncbi:MAG: putative dehydrogenase [Verrucomicrobiales bacterium]|jgi:predicted dehydrogenase